MKLQKRIAAALALCLTLVWLAPAAPARAEQGGVQLYYRMASSSTAENKAAWPANTGSVWMQTCVSQTLGTFQQMCYYNNLTAASGIPAGEHMTIEIPVSLPTAGYEEICLTFQYGRMSGDNDVDLCAVDRLELYASTDGGATWSERSASIRACELADVGTTDKSGVDVENQIWRVECGDLTALVPEGAVIDRLRLRPYGDYGPCYGATRIHWMEITGYQTARPAVGCDRVSFEGTGEMLVDDLALDTANRVYAPEEDFNGTSLPAAWSGQGELTAVTGTAALRAALHGKTVSVFGDSISTFAGWSNNTSFNPTIGSNRCHYPKEQMPSAELSWWLRTIRLAGMELLVNNSYSADKLDPNAAEPNVGLERCTRLHSADGRKPDVILIFFGTNDVANSNDEAFRTNYALMLSRIRAAYPKAELYCCSVQCGQSLNDKGVRYNAIVSELAADAGARFVDLWNSPLRSDPEASIDRWVHPTSLGMQIISELVLERMSEGATVRGADRAVRLNGGRAEYAVPNGSRADLIFSCKLAQGSSYTVRLGTQDSELAAVQLPLDGMQADEWYTVRVRADRSGVTVTTTGARAGIAPAAPGDLSGDGKTNGKDVTLLQRFLAGGYGVTLGDEADLNADGKVNGKDVTLLQRFLVGGYGVEL